MNTSDKLIAVRREIRTQYRSPSRRPWIVGFSGGKDSTLLAQLVVEVLLSIPADERTRPVYVVCNDTLVESPLFQSHVDSTLTELELGAEALSLPVTVVRTRPVEEESFWVNLLGRGYPAPNRTFRWCTDRMKIRPTSRFIRERLSESGEVVLLLGVRSSESPERARNLARRDSESDGSIYRPHDDLSGCWIYTPLKELTTDDVWVTLIESRPPWGGRYEGLIELYRDASDGECPFLISDAEVASCGSTSARFGCWTCTVVVKDRSLTALVGSGKSHLQPLVDYRERIKAVSADPTYRSKVRRNGQPGLGPITIDGRRLLLTELLVAQAACGKQLISEHELRLVYEQWERDEATATLRSLTVHS